MNLLVNLDVDDLEKAIRFYSSAFGLRIGRRFGASGVEMLGSSVPIYLLVKSPGTQASDATTQRRSYERHWTPVHIDFVVEEIEPAVQNAISVEPGLRGPSPRTSGENLHSWQIHSATDSVSSSSSGGAMTKSLTDACHHHGSVAKHL